MEDSLAAMKINNVSAGHVEVHLLSAQNGYATINVSKETIIPVSDAPNWGFYSLFSDGDVMAVRTKNTRTGTIMVYVLTADSGYQDYDVDTGTPIPVADAPNWIFRSIDGDRDLVGIRTKNTGTSQVKIYILSRASNYTEYMVDAVDIPIPVSEADDYVYFTVKRDLVCFRIKNTRNVEAHVLSAEANYQSFKFHAVTPIPVAEAANFIFTHYYSEDHWGWPTIGNFAQFMKVKGVGRFVEATLIPGFDRAGYRYSGRNNYVTTIAAVNASDFVFAGN